MNHSGTEAQEHGCRPVRPRRIPVLRLNWDRLSIVHTESKYLPFDGRKVGNTPLGKIGKGNLGNVWVHVMHVIAKALPYADKRIRASLGKDISLHKARRHLRPFALLSEGISLYDKPKNTFRDGLRHHERAEEVAISVKIKTLGRRRGEVMISDDALMSDFQVPVYALLYGLLMHLAERFLDLVPPNVLIDVTHLNSPRQGIPGT